MRIYALVGFLSLSFLGSFSAYAEQWDLDNDLSYVRFVTTKAVHISEANEFKDLSGVVTSSGKVDLAIDLDSVDTLIPIRNQRMRDFLFRTQEFPSANISGQIDFVRYSQLAVGETAEAKERLSVSVHGQTVIISIDVLVIRLAANKISVLNRTPILISSAQFQLEDGVEKLKKLAGLSDISYTVPVSFYLTFVK